jgi:hypothetical protein
MQNEQKKFLEYSDYRDLIKDKFVDLKVRHKKISLEGVASRIGISKSFLKMVIDKERHLAVDKLTKVSKVFGMSADEKNYFIFLALKTIVNDKDMEDFFNNLLLTLKAQQGVRFPNIAEELRSIQTFESSLTMILSSLARFDSFKDDPEWVAKQLNNKKISPEEIQSALQKSSADKTFVNGQGPPSENRWQPFKVGFKQMLDVVEDPYAFRPFQMYMCALAFDEANEAKAFELFLELREKLKALAAQSVNPNSVLFVNNGLACVAMKKE